MIKGFDATLEVEAIDADDALGTAKQQLWYDIFYQNDVYYLSIQEDNFYLINYNVRLLEVDKFGITRYEVYLSYKAVKK